MALPKGTVLKIGSDAQTEIICLRNPCLQIEKFRNGILAQMVFKDQTGKIVRKNDVMGIVSASGEVSVLDKIQVVLPSLPHTPLDRI